MSINRLGKFSTTSNQSQRDKLESISDATFLTTVADSQKPADARLVLDDVEEISKNNGLINEIGAPQSNFASFGTNLALESSSTSNTRSERPPRTNPLHDFEPVNYLLSLSCISSTKFNDAGEGDEILIAKSGGKGPQGDGVLGNDYYIDNLAVVNTVSPTSEGKSGTVFQVSFEVTEPFGTSFIDALITASKSLGYDNHLKAVYQMKIEFKGVDDNGDPSGAPIGYSTRIIPIHIFAVELRVEAGVTTYQIQAVPATYLGLTELHGVTQEQITVTGRTVGDVIDDFFNKYNATLQTLFSENRINQPDEYVFSRAESREEIVKAKIPYDRNSSSQNVINISNVNASAPGKTNNRQITVPAGTSMQAFIEAIVRESTFYRNQFDADMNPIGKDGFLKTLRTQTRLEIKNVTGGGGGNRPLYKFIWVLRDQLVSENYFRKQPDDIVSNVIPVREYNYLYTGKNKDILDFNVIYRFGFYQAIPYFKKTGPGQSNDAASGERPSEDVNEDTTEQDGVGTTQVTTEAVRYRKDGFIADLNTVNGEVATIFEQIIQDPSADLLVTQMEILGDPLWIEQKSVRNKSFQNSFLEDSPNIDINGAIMADEREVFVKINFKTPTDLDDNTGLFKIADAAFFEGQYKVFICESRFAGGIFTNVLQMVRMRHQTNDQARENLPQTNAVKIGSNGIEPGESLARFGTIDLAGATIPSNPILPQSQLESDNTTSNVTARYNKLNKTQKAIYKNLVSPTAQVIPKTVEEALTIAEKQFTKYGNN